MSDDRLSLAPLRAMTPTQAAAYWMACEDRDPSLFEQWLGETEENQVAWRKAQMVWGLFDDAGDDPMIAAMARAARQSGVSDDDAILAAEPVDVPEPANDRSWTKLLVAAVAVFMIAATVTFAIQANWFGAGGPSARIASADQADPLARFGTPDYVTGKGQKSIVDLPDGTRVTLASESALDLAFADSRRELRLLRGRAFFDVAHDPAHPFAVQAAGRVVTALGTRFDVSVRPGLLRIVLAQGSVSIASAAASSAAEQPIQLHPGQAFVAAGDKPGTVNDIDLAPDLSWHEGFAAFDNRPLSEVVETLNRSTRAQIVIRDPRVAEMRVTGQFRTGDIERFGRALELVLPVRIVARGADRYEIVSKR